MQQRLSGGRGLLLFKRKLLSVMSSIVVTENAKKIRPRRKASLRRRLYGLSQDQAGTSSRHWRSVVRGYWRSQ
jgi:hypothetical protein